MSYRISIFFIALPDIEKRQNLTMLTTDNNVKRTFFVAYKNTALFHKIRHKGIYSVFRKKTNKHTKQVDL